MGQTDARKLECCYQGPHHPLWVRAMTFLIRWHCDEHDEGSECDDGMAGSGPARVMW